MMHEPSLIPDDLAACQQLIEDMQRQLSLLENTASQQAGTIESQQQKIEKLLHELELFKRHLFGQRRERFADDPGQQTLFGSQESGEPLRGPPMDEAPEDSATPSRRRGHGRRPLAEFLPRRDVIHDLNEAERVCPCCGKPRVKVSEQTSEQLEYEPASLYVKRHVRYVYVCQQPRCGANMTTASKPPQPIDKGLAGPGLLASVVASKSADHLPLNRQEDILARYGIHIRRSTLCDWMAGCAELVTPLYQLLVQRTLESKVVGTDDTPVPVLDPELDHTRNGHFWACVGDRDHPYVCYDFTPNRSRDGPAAFFQGYTGYLQGDAYSGYIELARGSNGRITHVGCWAHARRYFVRAEEAAPDRQVHAALSFIQCLYDVEDEAAMGSSADRQALRQRKSVPLLDAFHRWLVAEQPGVLPSSPLGEAIGYTLHQWESLCVYTRDGDLPIDNNRTERVLRQQVMGRNNWVFVGSDRGGETAAKLYSLVASAKRLRIDPFAYLRDVFTRMPSIAPDQVEELLPDHWIQKHLESRLAHREKETTTADARRRARRAHRRQLAVKSSDVSR
jgi:transposase